MVVVVFVEIGCNLSAESKGLAAAGGRRRRGTRGHAVARRALSLSLFLSLSLPPVPIPLPPLFHVDITLPPIGTGARVAFYGLVPVQSVA